MNRDSLIAVTTRGSWTLVCAFLLGCAACGHGGTKVNGAGNGSGTGAAAIDAGADPFAAVDAGPEVVGSGTGSEPVDDPPLPPPKLDLVDTVETTEGRDKMSEALVKPAEKARTDRKFALAIVYYRAIVVARGPGGPEALTLAELWQLAGQSTEALEVLDAYMAAQTEMTAVRDARKKREQYAKASNAFATRIELPALDKEGGAMFEKGRKAYKKKQWGDALVYFQMGYALAPDLAGFLRELGATYKELKADDKRLEFYLRYLRIRPFGENADLIRKELKDEKGVLGTLTVETSLKCETVILINRQQMPQKQVKKPFPVAPGTYIGLCVSEKYEFGMWARAEVTGGGDATLRFNWALIENKLVKPYGRIRIENPDDPGVMMDLGVSSTLLGVKVPDDGRSLSYLGTSDDGSKTTEGFLKLVAGQTHEIKW